jgi:hypothetical protein
MCLKDWLDAKVRNQKTLTCMIILNISHGFYNVHITSLKYLTLPMFSKRSRSQIQNKREKNKKNIL